MMKNKIILSALLTCVCFCCFACGKSTFDLVENNMAEWTKTYFYAENSDYYANISSGEREKNYVMNGKSEERTAFALLTMNFSEELKVGVIKVNLTIDGNKSEKELEKNPFNNSYMIDLEVYLNGNEKISIEYNDKSLVLNAISNNFNINHTQALQIASEEFEKEIRAKKSFNNLNAEMYLRILDKNANEFDGLFWCFTVLNVDNESFSIVISTENGAILAKSS